MPGRTSIQKMRANNRRIRWILAITLSITLLLLVTWQRQRVMVGITDAIHLWSAPVTGQIMRVVLAAIVLLIATILLVLSIFSNIDTIEKSMPIWMRAILTNKALLLALILSGWAYLISIGRDAITPPLLPPMTFASIAPPQDVHTVIQPQDPSLMRVGDVFSMVAELRNSLTNNAPVMLLVTAPPDNQSMVQDFNAILNTACSIETHIPCRTASAPPSTIIPFSTRQGIIVHVEEDVTTLDSETLLDSLHKSLAKRFIVQKSQEIPPAVEKLFVSLRDAKRVWIDIGPRSPWRDDSANLNQGIPQKDVDLLRGWSESSKERAGKIAINKLGPLCRDIIRKDKEIERLKADPKSLPMINLLSHGLVVETSTAMYQYGNNIRREVVVVLQDLQLDRVDINNTYDLAMSPKTCEDIDIISSKLIDLSK